MATTMNAIADAIQPSALEALLTQTLADEAGLNDVAEGFKPILAYVASLASNQCVAETFHMFEWEKTCKAYLAPILADEEKCAAVTKKFMDESEKRVPKREVELDIPEGEGEILCNVEFKLAYGGKILLNTTHFHVRRGRIYGLLGHNGCGKSTLMRAISSGALAGFPGAEELMKLRACFVDHDIDGSDANTPTIDFCLQEPVLAPLGREKIREKLLEMEFTEELINKPICNLSGRLEDEARARARRAPERRSPAPRRADEPPGRPEAAVALRLPHGPAVRARHDARRVARLQVPQQGALGRDPLREHAPQALHGQPRPVRRAVPHGQGLLLDPRHGDEVHVPRAGPARGRQVAHQGHPPGQEHHVHLPDVPRPRPLSSSKTDWRNGSASDSSPEGYVFESRIGHLFDVEA